MMLQRFAGFVRVISDGRGWRVVDVLEDSVEARGRHSHELLNMLVALDVDVRKEEKLLVQHDHERGEVH